MHFVDLIETTLGVLEVETKTVPWIWTRLTFGLLQKAECRITGSAIEHYKQVRELSEGGHYMEEELWIFHTIPSRITMWHTSRVEYARAQGNVLDEHHRFLQWHNKLKKAVEDGNEGLIIKLIREREAEVEETSDWFLE